MKIRQGFVSNSSSSSFIIGFKTKPKKVEEIQKLLFGDIEYLSHPYESTGISSKRVAKCVLEDIIKQRSVTKRKMIEEMCTGYLDGSPDYNIDYDADRETWKKQIDEYRAAYEEFAEKELDKFLAANKGYKFYIVEYSDNDGSFYCFMEHGDVFNKIPHYRISKH